MTQALALQRLYGPIQGEIDRVEAILRDELQSDNPFLASLVAHSHKFGGKRMRSAMLLYSARICGGSTDAHASLAAVVELLHSATLVHDDVLDEALLRRRVDTLNSRWGNETSILFGDYLFAKAFILCSRLNNHEANRILGRLSDHEMSVHFVLQRDRCAPAAIMKTGASASPIVPSAPHLWRARQ